MTTKADTLITQLGEPSTWGRDRMFGFPPDASVVGSRWSGWSDHKNEEQGYITPLYDRAQLEKLMALMISEFNDVLRHHRGEDTGTLSYRIEDHFKG